MAWLAVGAYLIALGISAALRTQGDFAVYYQAGQRAAARLSMYPPGDISRFLYAPIFAIGFIPFVQMPLGAAQVVFFAINAAALIALIIGAGRMLFGARPLPASLIIMPLLAVARFVNNNVQHGQINLIALALLVWAIVCAREGRSRASGLMLAAAILTKPFALLAALYLLLRRRFAALGWTALSGALLLALPMVVFGTDGALAQTADYVRAIASMGARYRTMLTNQSATSAAVRILSANGASLMGEQGAFMLGMALELAMVAAVALWIKRAKHDERGDRLALCAMFALMPSFAPVSWKSYYAALLIPYMALVSALWLDRPRDRRPPIAAIALGALSVLLNLAGGRRFNQLALFYSAHFLSSLSVLAALAILWRDELRGADGAGRDAVVDG